MSLSHEDIIQAGEYNRQKAAEQFLCLGLQSWGQSQERIDAAVDGYMRAAGFDLEKDRDKAKRWLNSVLGDLRRGKFEDEVQQLVVALNMRRKRA